ncbi:uncharacterized protein J8A68_005876 [[Candida] subhashii]|uniref:UDENN FLCN/SMCR8-type domain-containing protein n=1 Tax=[Candida] subhashii TaxID=561895 RepID=A0A8J5QLB1_9ASCO|nr:uncharacterized protein J8A68_005876 [[Candida] subhashii]KAG7660610.1 hypothetical protein J8A68_005876 [[Candida] subhashii]
MANYIVCLAHFCELHGPSTIVCTQVTTENKKEEYILPSNSRVQVCSSCQLILPDEDAVNIVTKDSTANSNANTTRVFISTHYPLSQKRYTSLTKLVMKSLSVETTAESSKPMFYGDMIYGYCINKIFKINDLNARGSERKYSLMLISDSETDLLMNWDIITIYFNEIIDMIQQRVATITEENIKRDTANGSNLGMLGNEKYLRRSLIKPKSLVELTNDTGIFVKIHLWAVELLKDILK